MECGGQWTYLNQQGRHLEQSSSLIFPTDCSVPSSTRKPHQWHASLPFGITIRCSDPTCLNVASVTLNVLALCSSCHQVKSRLLTASSRSSQVNDSTVPLNGVLWVISQKILFVLLVIVKGNSSCSIMVLLIVNWVSTIPRIPYIVNYLIYKGLLYVSCKGSENPALQRITIRSGAGPLSSIEYGNDVEDNDDDE